MHYVNTVNLYASTYVLVPTLEASVKVTTVGGKRTLRQHYRNSSAVADGQDKGSILRMYPLSECLLRREARQLLTAYKGNTAVPKEQRWTLSSDEELKEFIAWMSSRENNALVLAWIEKNFTEFNLRNFIVSAVQLAINRNIDIARDTNGKVLDNQNAVLTLKG